jgi:hypothetical protein
MQHLNGVASSWLVKAGISQPASVAIATYDLSRFLDKRGRLRAWPTRPAKRWAALAYLATKFEDGRNYAEEDVNVLLCEWHTFDDHTLLRGELCNRGFLSRTVDSSRYWKLPSES